MKPTPEQIKQIAIEEGAWIDESFDNYYVQIYRDELIAFANRIAQMQRKNYILITEKQVNVIQSMKSTLCKLADHDQDCGVFDIDEDGKHKDCTCGLRLALDSASNHLVELYSFLHLGHESAIRNHEDQRIHDDHFADEILRY